MKKILCHNRLLVFWIVILFFFVLSLAIKTVTLHSERIIGIEPSGLYRDFLSRISPFKADQIIALDEPLEAFSRSQFIELPEHEAKELDAYYPESSFIPHYDATITFVTQANVKLDSNFGFNHLRHTDFKIFILRRDLPAVLISMLAEDSATADPAISLLHHLEKTGRLIIADELTELLRTDDLSIIAVIRDSQAVELMKSGASLNIHVPSDHSLTFRMGLFSSKNNRSANTMRHSNLPISDFGLRDLQGHADPLYYPPPGAYASASPASQVAHYELLEEQIRQELSHTILHSSVLTRDRIYLSMLIYLLAALIFAIWSAFYFIRVFTSILQQFFFIQVSAIVFWIMIRIIQLVVTDAYDSLLWYWNFCPVLIISASSIFLWSEHLIRKPKVKTVIQLISCIFSVFCLLLILTNDLHQKFGRIFRIHSSTQVEYFPAGYLILFYITLTVLIPLLSLVYIVWSSKLSTKGVVLVVLTSLFFAYIVSFYFKVSFVLRIDFSLTSMLSIFIIWEIMLSLGYLSRNIYYWTFSDSTHIPFAIYTQENVRLFRSKVALQLSSDVLNQMQQKPSVSVRQDNFEFKQKSLRGGKIIWSRDLTTLNHLQRQKLDLRERILNQRAILSYEAGAKQAVARINSERNLSEGLEKLIQPSLDEIISLNDQLELEPDNPRILLKLKQKIGFCKRIGLLYYNTQTQDLISLDQLHLLCDEAARDYTVSGHEIGVFLDAGGSVSPLTALHLLELFHLLLEQLSDEFRQFELFARMRVAEEHFRMDILIALPSDRLETFRLGFAQKAFTHSDLKLLQLNDDDHLHLRLQTESHPDSPSATSLSDEEGRVRDE